MSPMWCLPYDAGPTPEEIETCRQIAAELGVKLRIRSFIDS